MNCDIVWTTQFKKDYKLALKRHLDVKFKIYNYCRWKFAGEGQTYRKYSRKNKAWGSHSEYAEFTAISNSSETAEKDY